LFLSLSPQFFWSTVAIVLAVVAILFETPSAHLSATAATAAATATMFRPQLLFLTTLLVALTGAVTPAGTTVTFRVPATHALPNPFELPPSTRATLSSFRKAHHAPLTTLNTFVFHNVSAGSYLVDVHCVTHTFVPLRLDVRPAEDGTAAAAAGKMTLRVWETFRGNDWENKGEAVPLLEGGVFEVRVLRRNSFFTERSKCELFPFSPSPFPLHPRR
jgi:ER membrane protein complex subunit 7